MMEEKHFIKKAVFDISFGSESDAKAEQYELSAFMKSGILPVVEEVFQEISGTRGGRIERLEIDLGVVDYLDFQTTLPARLRIKLKTALELALSREGSRGSKFSEEKLPPSQVERERDAASFSFQALKVFLVHGRFPERETAFQIASLDEMFLRHLEQNREAFVTFLRNTTAREEVLRRILLQCVPLTWQRVVEALSPKQASFLIGLAENIEKRLAQRRTDGSSATTIRFTIWECLFDRLLRSPQGQIDVKQWLEKVLEKNKSAEEGIPGAQVGKGLSSLFSKMLGRLKKEKPVETSPLNVTNPEKGTVSLDELMEIKGNDLSSPNRKRSLSEGLTPQEAPGSQKDPSEAHVSAAEIAYFKAWLYDAFTAEQSLQEVRSMWAELMADRAEILHAVVLKAGRRMVVRRFMVSELSDAMLSDIVTLIAPALRQFVLAFVARPALLAPLDQREGAGAGEVKKRVWECTLTYLIVDRGSRFNKKSYLESIVRQMSAHRNISAELMLHSLVDGLAELATDPEMRHEMAQLLLEISDEWKGSVSPTGLSVTEAHRRDTHDTDEARADFAKSYEYDTLLEAYFLEGLSAKASHMKGLLHAIDFLAGARPLQLLKLYRGFQQRLQSGGEIHWPMDTVVLRRLTEIFLSLSTPTHELANSELLRAFKRYADQSVAKSEYCKSVLTALLKDQLIDFEDILSRVARSKSSTEGSTTQVNGPEFDAASKQLLLKLQVKESLVEGDFEDIRDLWPMLVRDHPRLLRDVVFELGRESGLRLRLARRFPDLVLSDIVQVAEPKATPLIQNLLSQKVFLTSAPGGEIARAKNREIFWDFTLSYVLVQRGSRFNQKAYLGSLVGVLAGRENRAYHTLLFFLKDQVLDREVGTVVKSELCHILLELCDEAQLAAPLVKKSSSQEKGRLAENRDDTEEKLQESYDLFEYLKRALSIGNRDSQSLSEDESRTLVVSLERLLKSHPWQLLRLFRELSTGGISRARFALVFESDAPVRLIKVFLSLASTSGASDLIQAIQDNAGKVKDKALFYRQIFECLIQNRVIDFEALIRGNQGGRPVLRPEKDSDAPLSALQVPLDKALPQAYRESLEDAPPATSAFNVSEAAASKSLGVEDAGESQVMPSAESRLLSYLQASRPFSQGELNRWSETLGLLMSHQPVRLRTLLKKPLEEARMMERLLALLTANKRAELLFILKPALAREILVLADMISNACFFEGLILSRRAIDDFKWRYVFCFLFEEARFFTPAAFASAFTAYLAAEVYEGRYSAFTRKLCQQLAKDILPSTEQQTQLLIADLDRSLDLTHDSGVRNRLETRTVDEALIAETLEPGELLHVSNAGLVLAAPYFERLFSTLKMTETSAFIDTEQATRAVHLLQFLVNESTENPEYLLGLNKMLCGLDLSFPIPLGIELTQPEKELCEGLIEGMISNWKVMKNTSIAGFRESFLQRDGVIELKDEAWQLTVFSKPYDMLLDQLPWGYSTLKFPWMDRVLHVKWR